MKKQIIYLLLLILIPVSALGWGVINQMGSSIVNGGEDSCGIGNLVASWHMEDANLANEDGCIDGVIVAGDTIWEPISSAVISSTDKSEGSNSVSAPTASDYYKLDPTTCNIEAEGQAYIDFRIVTFNASSKLLDIYSTIGSDEISIFMSGTSTAADISLGYEGNNTLVSVRLDTNIDVVADNTKWYRIKAQYKVGTNGLKAEMWSLDSASPREIDTLLDSVTLSGTVTSMTTDPTRFNIGLTGAAGASYVDRFYLYNASDDL